MSRAMRDTAPEAWFCEKCDEIVFKEDIDCG